MLMIVNFPLFQSRIRIGAACCVGWLMTAGFLSAQTPPPAAEDIRGPKELVEIPVPEKPPVELWAGIGVGVLVVLVVWLLYRKFSGKRNRKRPPEVALATLSELASTREALGAEAFANRAAQTVREFISDQFGLAAPKRTTEEFLHDLAAKDSPIVNEGDHLRVFLKSCDLAKFAGAGLNLEQRDDLLEAARGFVRATSASVKGGKRA